MNFIVLSSSRGTTFQSVIDALGNGSLTATCLGLVTDSADRGCVEKATLANIPVQIAEKKEDETREQFERRVQNAIEALGSPDVIALMGWMWIFSAGFMERWKGKMINVHPALLPKYGGEGMYGSHVHNAVLESGDSESGITIHTVDTGVDTGNILLQKTCPVEAGDTAETLQKRVQELEKIWYPRALEMIEKGDISL